MNLFFGLDDRPGPLSNLGSYDAAVDAAVGYGEGGTAALELPLLRLLLVGVDAAAAAAAAALLAAAACPSQCLIRKGSPAAAAAA